jgi:hypothetical protein
MKTMVSIVLASAIAYGTLVGPADARVVFIDNFEYQVGRNDPNARTIFMSHGWTHVKTQQVSSGGGYLYTVPSIPGFAGRFPGLNSTQVLAIEALPGTMQAQTDFYLQLGDGGSSAYDNTIPGDVWFQFWVYPQNYGSQLSRYGSRNKFMYVCNAEYPCRTHLWMLSQGAPTYNPEDPYPLGDPSTGEFNLYLADSGSPSVIWDSLKTERQDIIGVHDTSEWMAANRWTLVKMHFNTTATTGNSWEVWLRPYGGAWTKVSEWIGGQTPGFTWDIPADSVGGHRVLRMPTTVGSPDSQWYDYWMYIDDFVIATTEEELPSYSDLMAAPRPPSQLRVQ